MTIIILYSVKIDLEGLSAPGTVERARNHVVSIIPSAATAQSLAHAACAAQHES